MKLFLLFNFSKSILRDGGDLYKFITSSTHCYGENANIFVSKWVVTQSPVWLLYLSNLFSANELAEISDYDCVLGPFLGKRLLYKNAVPTPSREMLSSLGCHCETLHCFALFCFLTTQTSSKIPSSDYHIKAAAPQN